MPINHIFYKNNLIAEIESQTSTVRQQLLDELVAAGSDPVVWKRRFQMLKHLNIIQAQLIDKVYNFETDDPLDYVEMDIIHMDILLVTSRNA